MSGPLLAARGISKTFGGVRAVLDADLDLAPGRVHGLVGENGAGKSTLAKIVAGVLEPDAGELLLEGRPVRFATPRDALAEGVATIAQEIALVPRATVAENVLLGIEPRAGGFVRRLSLQRRFEELNARSGFGLRGGARVASLRTADQQKVEILRAIARDARLIVMDEPTAALTRDESALLLEIVQRLAAGGTAVLLISHYLDEVLGVCDTVTVMRDGRVVRTSRAETETPQSLVAAMVGREVTLEYPPKRPPEADAPVVLDVCGLTRRGAIEDVSFRIRAGEVVGLAGLVGSGRSEVARAIFGADVLDSGEVRLDGEPLRLRGPRQAIRHGIAMLPESRKEQGLVMMRSVRENITLSTLPDFAAGGLVSRRRERARARELADDLSIRTKSLDAPVGTLSGGNQQKVLFARWLVRPPRVLIVDEPTRGVDVGAKRQIHELILDLAERGMAVLVISSELEEVLGLSHRVLVMRRGRLAGEFDHTEATMECVMSAAFAAEEAAAA